MRLKAAYKAFKVSDAFLREFIIFVDQEFYSSHLFFFVLTAFAVHAQLFAFLHPFVITYRYVGK